MPETRPVLLFDIMDTLVVDPFHEAIPAFFGLSLPELIQNASPGAWVLFERGELLPSEYAERMFADGRSVEWHAFEAHVRAAYRWVEGMEELLTELRGRGIEMHALSNYPVLYRVVDEVVGLSRFVELSFVSCNTRHRKPDPEAFLHASRELGRSPAECLLIDDRPQNCEAARRLGMPAVEFEDAKSLAHELRALGLL